MIRIYNKYCIIQNTFLLKSSKQIANQCIKTFEDLENRILAQCKWVKNVAKDSIKKLNLALDAPMKAKADQAIEWIENAFNIVKDKATLTKILTYHVIAGTFDAAAVVKAIQANGGSLSLTTVSGNKLVASIKQGKVTLTDEKGNSATVVAADLTATNGVIHVIDAVVLPK